MSLHVPVVLLLITKNTSTIRVGLSLLFEFKGICIEVGIRGFCLFTFRLIVYCLLVHGVEVQ